MSRGSPNKHPAKEPGRFHLEERCWIMPMSTHENNIPPRADAPEKETAVQTVRAVISGKRELNVEDFQKVAENFEIPITDA